jgi:hypothetical protein
MFGDVIAQMNDMLDAVLEGETLDKMADVYKIMLDKLMERGFERAEAIEILSRQGGFKAG